MGVWVPAQGESWAELLWLLNISVPTLIVLKCETLRREGEEAEGLVALKPVVVCTPCEVKTEALEEKLSNLMTSSFVAFLTRDLKAGTLFLHQYCCWTTLNIRDVLQATRTPT